MGFLQPEAEGSPTPVPETDTFERSVSESDLSKINRYGREVQGK